MNLGGLPRAVAQAAQSLEAEMIRQRRLQQQMQAESWEAEMIRQQRLQQMQEQDLHHARTRRAGGAQQQQELADETMPDLAVCKECLEPWSCHCWLVCAT